MSENTNENINSEITQDELNELIKVRREKLKALQDAGKDPFQIVKYDVNTFSNDINEKFEELEGKIVSIAGRMMSKRIMGKASFCHIQDKNGQVQSYVAKTNIGDEFYNDFKRYDIGDIVGITGEVFKTQKGEISVKAHEVVLLSKSLEILPEKYHGLKDTEIRYRQRYIDLIVNPEVKEVFKKRSAIVTEIRSFLSERDYMEVETPVLQTIAGGASARPFVTHHNALDIDMYLRIALELPLKRLIVGGFDRVYEIGRVFRNEGVSVKHNPEFTLIELYEAYTDYYGMMELTETLIRRLANKVNGTGVLTYGDKTIDFDAPFKVITMIDAVKEYSGVDFNQIKSNDEAKQIAKEKHIEFEAHHSKGDILAFFFEAFAEEHLIQPTFVIDHPIEISPLTKKKPENPELTERFELFVFGRELANAYSELNDPIDQLERFKHQEMLRECGDDEANMIDDDFVTALSYGMPPTGGLGIGIDRLVMFLTNSQSIRDVLFFPTMKPLA